MGRHCVFRWKCSEEPDIEAAREAIRLAEKVAALVVQIDEVANRGHVTSDSWGGAPSSALNQGSVLNYLKVTCKEPGRRRFESKQFSSDLAFQNMHVPSAAL